MTFSRLDSAIALGRSKSQDIAAIDPQLDSFVAGYLVVDVISEFEQRLEAMFALRARKFGDAPNANFVAAMLSQKFRSPDVGKINDMLKKHDPTILAAFAASLAPSKWDTSLQNLMQARHYHVHKSGSRTMTTRDVEQAYLEAVKLFDAAASALGLSTADCAHFT